MSTDTIKILSITTLTSFELTTLAKIIAVILKVNIGDEILFILDKNGIINIRKSEGKLILKSTEKFLSSSKIGGRIGSLYLTIPKDIMNILKIQEGDNIAWILDENNNVIIKDAVLPDSCTISGIMVDTSIISYQSTTIPINVRDLILVEVGDIVILAIKNGNLIIKGIGEDVNDLEVIAVLRLNFNRTIHLRKEIQNIINPIINIINTNDILWILNKDGDIIMRNTVLPSICKF